LETIFDHIFTKAEIFFEDNQKDRGCDIDFSKCLEQDLITKAFVDGGFCGTFNRDTLAFYWKLFLRKRLGFLDSNPGY
jgi:hypothetical protein